MKLITTVSVLGDETYRSDIPSLATFDFETTPMKTKADIHFGGHLPETKEMTIRYFAGTFRIVISCIKWVLNGTAFINSHRFIVKHMYNYLCGHGT
jgi:hypothetical protein